MSAITPDPSPIRQWPCPLCGVDVPGRITVDDRRYAKCPACMLIALDPSQRPTLVEEAARYATHQNNEADAGYRAFLQRLAGPVCSRTPVGSRGLDFGCGPGPVLAAMLTQGGRPTVAYDPIFAADDRLLAERYDFIVCSEVVEHLHDPARTFARFGQLLRHDGLLAIMTRFHGPGTVFETWWYRRDFTHVCFFAEETMQWIATRHGWELELPSADIALFRLP